MFLPYQGSGLPLTYTDLLLVPVAGIQPANPAYRAGPLALRINRRGASAQNRTELSALRELHIPTMFQRLEN